MDVFTKEKRSAIMAAIPSSNTSIELLVRKALLSAGFRPSNTKSKLSGKPDIVVPRLKLAVFVHGCFWHGHTCHRAKLPSSNQAFWEKKIAGNARRDRRNIRKLRGDGWRVHQVWQCSLEAGIRRVIAKAKRLSCLHLITKQSSPNVGTSRST